MNYKQLKVLEQIEIETAANLPPDQAHKAAVARLTFYRQELAKKRAAKARKAQTALTATQNMSPDMAATVMAIASQIAQHGQTGLTPPSNPASRWYAEAEKLQAAYTPQMRTINASALPMPPSMQPSLPPAIPTSTPAVLPELERHRREELWGWVFVVAVAATCLCAGSFLLIQKSPTSSSLILTPNKSPPSSKLDPPPHLGQKIGPYAMTSSFGWRIHPITGVPTPHRGIDFGMPLGAPYYMLGAPGTSGSVSCWGNSGAGGESHGGGYVATITSNDDRYQGYKFQLLHLNEGSCQNGTHHAGDKIGEVGSTGLTTGPHCHFEQIISSSGKKIPASATPIKETLGVH